MFEYIDKLRKKPEGERRRAAFVISGCITGGIAVIWLIALIMKIDAGGFKFDSNDGSASTIAASSTADTWRKFMGDVDRIISETSDRFGEEESTSTDAVSSDETASTSASSSAIIESI